VELLITRLAIACFTAVFGNAFSKWFLNTKAGAWFQKKLDSVLEFLQKRYDIEIAKKEVKWRRDYPLLAKRIDNLEAKIEGYEQWAKKLDE
tara:strand:+ start:485 stop:757 length:273 start_codon:yes stop_codon:yes gene_type:complete